MLEFHRGDTRAAAAYAGVSASFLNKSRLTGDGPEHFKVGRRVIYERDAVDRWLASRRRRSTSDTGEA